MSTSESSSEFDLVQVPQRPRRRMRRPLGSRARQRLREEEEEEIQADVDQILASRREFDLNSGI